MQGRQSMAKEAPEKIRTSNTKARPSSQRTPRHSIPIASINSPPPSTFQSSEVLPPSQSPGTAESSRDNQSKAVLEETFPLLSDEQEPAHDASPIDRISAWTNDIPPQNPAPPSSISPDSQSMQRNGAGVKVVVDGIEREGWEVLTQDPGDENSQIYPDIAAIQAQHAKQITHYKTLLIRAQSASSASLHDLHRKLHDLQEAYHTLQEKDSRRETDRGLRVSDEKLTGMILDHLDKPAKLKETIGALSQRERLRLLGLVVDGCYPSDVDAQIKLLEKCKRSKMDILGRLPCALSVRVLSHLKLKEVVDLRLVCKRYDSLCSMPALWRDRCRLLEKENFDDDKGLSHPAVAAEIDWLSTFQSLWQREQRWARGTPQTIHILRGHTGRVGCLKLEGNTLISGSHDDGTIRIWHLDNVHAAKAESPIMFPAKAVSCLNYHFSSGVLAHGTRDTGKVHVWRKTGDGGKWQSTQILSGHLRGIRALAVNDRWTVSAGEDKAIVVWDWRTGSKIVRFGQQPNTCVNVGLFGDHVICVTVDGTIRVFSIPQGEVLGQYKISELCTALPSAKKASKDVSLGSGGNRIINWFELQGRDMVCGTRELVLRFEWTEERQGAENATPCSASDFGPTSIQKQSSTRGMSEPITPVKTPVRQRTTSNYGKSPLKSPSPVTPKNGPALNKLAKRTVSSSLMSSPRRISDPSSSSTSLSPISRHTPSKRTSTAPSSMHEAPIPCSRQGLSISFAIPPSIKEVIKFADIERGAFDGGRGRIVTSTRFGPRPGIERQLYVTSKKEDGTTVTVPLDGAWKAQSQQLGLQTAEKNPMSIVMDREKIVYGCTDGSIVIVSFI